MKASEKQITVNGKEITVYKINHGDLAWFLF